MVLKIGINGFGRIGRLVVRAAQKDPRVQVQQPRESLRPPEPHLASGGGVRAVS